MRSQTTWIGRAVLIFILILGTTVSQAADVRDFRAFNYTGSVITSIYVTDHWSIDWHSDVLGLHTLPDGYQTTISFNPLTTTSCFFDFKLVFADGSTQTYAQGWNLCKFSAIYFYDGYLTAN